MSNGIVLRANEKEMLCVLYFTICAIFVLYNIFSIQIQIQAAAVCSNMQHLAFTVSIVIRRRD